MKNPQKSYKIELEDHVNTHIHTLRQTGNPHTLQHLSVYQDYTNRNLFLLLTLIIEGTGP